MKPLAPFQALSLRRPITQAVLALLTLAAAGAAQAVVSPPASTSAGGAMTSIDYGNGGNVFELVPQLFVQGLGSAGDPLAVTSLNPLLQYSFLVSGAGTGLMTIDYRVRNASLVDSFSQLRFMVYANPDGDPVDFADTVHETWGAALAGDPVRREAQAFSNPADTLLSRFQLNNNLTDGPPAAACAASPGCDATLGLQWNATLLGPGETLRVRVGLSDNGQHLSSRWLDATAVNSPDTVLTLSGTSQIVPVPEPGAFWMLASGLAALGWLAQRRSRP